ncbi:MAG: hypothetical protein ABEJ36_06555 [Candidatus Nanosalina sp.]
MEREKIEEEFHDLLDEVVDGIEDKLDIEEAVQRRSSSRTAGKVASNSDTLKRKVIRPEINSYRRDLKTQFSTVLDAVEQNEDVREFERKLLKHDIFHQNMSPRSEEVREKIMQRFENLHGAMQKLRDAEGEDVWDAVGNDFSEEEAREFIREMFGFLEELEDHEHRLEYVKNVSLADIGLLLPIDVEIDYTPEAIEVMKESEGEVRQKLDKKVDGMYD